MNNIYRLNRFIWVFVLIPVLLAGQINRFEENKDQAKSPAQKMYPVHISHLLNSPEARATYGELIPKNSIKRKKADTVGDLKTFKVWNSKLAVFDNIEFKLMRKGNASQLWFATGEITNGHLTEDVADTMIYYLESRTNEYSFDPNKGVIALDNAIFGDAPDIDNDGLTDAFVCDIKDTYDPDAGSSGYIAGFFHPNDQYINSNSNYRDIIYMDSYPGIYDGTTTNPLRPLSTLAHEYQHLIHFNYYGRLNIDQWTFINESQSNFASLLTGFFPHGSYYQYMQNTNVSLFKWGQVTVLPDYGRAAVWSCYLWDRWGFQNAGNLTSSGIVGVTGIESALAQSGSDWTFADLLTNWGVANYINDTLATGNRNYGYKNPVINFWKADPNVIVADPNVASETISVLKSAVTYLAYKGVSDLKVTVSFAGSFGRMKVFTKKGDAITVADLGNGVEYSAPAGEIFDEITIMLVNTDVSGHGAVETASMDFTYTSSGTVSKNTASTYSPIAKYYWPIPYYNSTNVGRLGFSNQFTLNPGGYLTKLRLYTVTGNSEDGPIAVIGEGKLRYAVYTDNGGIPGEVVHADTIDFSEVTAEWNDIDVSQWNFPIPKDVPFHAVYEVIVPVVDRDINSIPLRLDDGTGVQGVTNVVTGYSPFTTEAMFDDTDPGTQYNVWNEIEYLVDPTVAINEDELQQPLSFILMQNYPNPFNPTTVIKYQVGTTGQVDLQVYNSVGQKVKTLVSGLKPAGSFESNWDGTNELGQQVSSGIYFYRLKSGSQQLVKKMILMR